MASFTSNSIFGHLWNAMQHHAVLSPSQHFTFQQMRCTLGPNLDTHLSVFGIISDIHLVVNVFLWIVEGVCFLCYILSSYADALHIHLLRMWLTPTLVSPTRWWPSLTALWMIQEVHHLILRNSNIILPSELAKHAISEGTKSVMSVLFFASLLFLHCWQRVCRVLIGRCQLKYFGSLSLLSHIVFMLIISINSHFCHGAFFLVNYPFTCLTSCLECASLCLSCLQHTHGILITFPVFFFDMYHTPCLLPPQIWFLVIWGILCSSMKSYHPHSHLWQCLPHFSHSGKCYLVAIVLFKVCWFTLFLLMYDDLPLVPALTHIVIPLHHITKYFLSWEHCLVSPIYPSHLFSTCCALFHLKFNF